MPAGLLTMKHARDILHAGKSRLLSRRRGGFLSDRRFPRMDGRAGDSKVISQPERVSSRRGGTVFVCLTTGATALEFRLPVPAGSETLALHARRVPFAPKPSALDEASRRD